MPVSLYYSVHFDDALSAHERAIVIDVVARWASTPAGDAFGFHEIPERTYVLDGATALPPTRDRFEAQLLHCLRALAELRVALPRGAWRVHLGHVDFPWNAAARKFEVPKTRI